MRDESQNRGTRIGGLTLGLILAAAAWSSLASVVPPVGATAVALTAAQAGPPTCSRSWIEHEPAIEETLRTAAIDRIDVVPIGVTKPKRAFFAAGGSVASATWKPLRPGRRSGYWESYKSEIAAYELDKLLGLRMVPPAVERQIDNETGAIILWLDSVMGWDREHPVRGPEPEWTRQISRMKMFDQLVANIDRNQGNLLYDADWHLLLIDHSRAFTAKKDLSGIAPLQSVDRTLWGRIDALTLSDLQRALGPWLDEDAIKAILVRRDKMREEIKKRVAKLGEARVFVK
jgi:hypothetical protein